MLLVERHYLRVHGMHLFLILCFRLWTCNSLILAASFAENFYGLKRRRRPLYETPRATAAAGNATGVGKLRSQDIRRSLLFLVRGNHQN